MYHIGSPVFVFKCSVKKQNIMYYWFILDFATIWLSWNEIIFENNKS